LKGTQYSTGYPHIKPWSVSDTGTLSVRRAYLEKLQKPNINELRLKAITSRLIIRGGNSYVDKFAAHVSLL
jgi:hypothetical protein